MKCLKNKQVIVHYSDVSTIQMFAIQIQLHLLYSICAFNLKLNCRFHQQARVFFQDKDEETTFRLVTKQENCDNASHLLHTSFRGKLGKSGLPEKQGTLDSVKGTRTHVKGPCITVDPSIQSISGQFVSGLIQAVL